MLDGSAGDFDDSTVTEKGSVCSFNSESTLGDGVGWFERDIPIIDNGTFENEINTSSSDLYSNTKAITFYEEFESVERLCDSLPSTRTSRCTIIIAGNKCTATSTIFSLHSLSSAQQKQMIDRAAEVELSGLEKYQLKFNDWLFGFLLSKRFNVQNKLLSHFEKYFSNNNNFDETMFERVTVVEKYFNVVAEQCASPDFSRVFLTSLSHTIGCSLMSFFLTFL
ncbi:hypothetical protein O0L34_g12477 [Tuta absoluta]|nr:hypothetical protein O0L34_g12477 [Tuta absoluta]